MGKAISAARIRQVWLNPDLSAHAAAATVGLSRGALWARAMGLQLPCRAAVRRAQRLDDLQRLRADPTLTNAQIAARLGVSESTVTLHAARAGLPARAHGPKLGFSRARFARLYLAGVALSELAVLFGRDRSTLSHHVKRLGLPPRGAGWVAKVTLQDVRQAELGARMAAARQAEVVALAAQKEAA